MKIELNQTNSILVLTKSRNALYKSWILFFVYSLFLFGGFCIILYYSSTQSYFYQYVFAGLIFFCVFYLINKKNLNFTVCKIQNLGENKFKINDDVIVDINEELLFLNYQYTGELFLNISGNLFLKTPKGEFRICNGISNKETEFIIKSIQAFLNIGKIEIQYKRI